uniref:THIF-type NAD/FAD binding fold domain-containing protein n=1 Tax=Grammatophora oceanica TaxID=210454 RepID=A0A7S1YCA2_9STRA
MTAEMLSNYDIVLCSRIGMIQANRIAEAMKGSGGKFYMVDCFGWMGTAVMDLGPNYEYRKEQGKKKGELLSEVLKLEPYVPLEEIWKVPLNDLKMKRIERGQPPLVWTSYLALLSYHAAKNGTWPSPTSDDFEAFCKEEWEQKDHHEVITDYSALAKVALAEVSPVCAILGGVMGNEVIKAISGKGEPANNVILLNALDGKCRYILCNKKKEETNKEG